MATRKNVPASTVRDWARTPEGSKALTEAGAKFPGERGRLDPSTIAVFHKDNPSKRYETASEAEKRTVTVKVKALDKNGRATTKPITMTTEKARALLGHPAGRKGRFDMAVLALAVEANLLAGVEV